MGERCAKVLGWRCESTRRRQTNQALQRFVSHSKAWFAASAATAPRARKESPISPTQASHAAKRATVRIMTINSLEGIVSPKETRRPGKSRNTTPPYGAAAARAGERAVPHARVPDR